MLATHRTAVVKMNLVVVTLLIIKLVIVTHY